jgi:4-hydroxy-tetrahydrodipicolinate reductase
MNILLLGHGKTGALVAEVARRRGHEVRVLRSAQNPHAAALTPGNLRGVDVVVDFTTPHAVLANIEACLRAGARMVVGTTGWYGELDRVRNLAGQSRGALLYAANFSIGVNLFFDVARAASAALKQDYSGRITERHHAQKKDAPSGTAAALQKLIAAETGVRLEIDSIREGDIVGEHTVTLESAHDLITLKHQARSRRAFAEGAIRAAEWLQDKRGFYDFAEVFRELP